MENLILSLIDDSLIGAIVVAILGGGLLAGIAAFRKAKPEISKITVEIAGQAVIVQKEVIDSLQQELKRQGEDLRAVESENKKCQEENREFKRIMGDLQEKLKRNDVRMDRIEEKQN